jgi:hypothetical protein
LQNPERLPQERVDLEQNTEKLKNFFAELSESPRSRDVTADLPIWLGLTGSSVFPLEG